MVNASSSSIALTERDFKYFFRTSSHDTNIVGNMFDLMDDVKNEKGVKDKTNGLILENTLQGLDMGKIAKQYAQEKRLQCNS